MSSDKHLLIAFDNSPASIKSLHYCSLLFADDPDVTFHLLHCHSGSAGVFLPKPVNQADSLLPENDFDKGQENISESILAKGVALLKSYDISEKSIECSSISTANQIAESIIFEAHQKLFDSIIVARRGLGYLGEMVLGSVSATLFRNSHTIPLWVIDGEIVSKDVLVGVDGSVDALRAIEHLAHIFRNRGDVTFYFYHCTVFLAPAVVCTLDNFYREWDRNWCDTYLAGVGCLYDGPKQLLKEAGIDKDRVVVLPETRTIQESTSIITQARNHKCGTIVIGRRGPGVTKGFFGGVSNQTIRQTQNMAVWVVG